MNTRDMDILLRLWEGSPKKQRQLAAACGCALGAVNASVKNLLSDGYIDGQLRPTEKAAALLQRHSPRRAVLLAAGTGMHHPISGSHQPKPLLEVRSQRLIHRLIEQLQAVGITEIYAVVGFAKEKFEYLTDAYGVELIVNSQYGEKNNLHSLALAAEHLENCYIVPCDLWCRDNPFRSRELYSWYLVSEADCPESTLRVNRKQELTAARTGEPGNLQLGISYLLEEDAREVARLLQQMDADRRYKGAFWEETLYRGSKLFIPPRTVDAHAVVHIESFADLWELEERGEDVAREQICRVLKVQPEQISQLSCVKRGTTNTTWSFSCQGQELCIRIPTGRKDKLVDHRREAAVYAALAGQALAEQVIFFDPDTGIKVSQRITPVRSCDPQSDTDMAACMQCLRQFHETGLQADHHFDLFDAIDFYEAAWGGEPSLYPDYPQTKARVFALRQFIREQTPAYCLCHIDPVPENFLIPAGAAPIRLIDWEYAAMQDPHVDIAMFCLQAQYKPEQIDAAINAYFPEGCTQTQRQKIYCYIAVGGLLWSNWCEYEMRRGTEFGAYSLKQYRYAKQYSKLVQIQREQEGRL